MKKQTKTQELIPPQNRITPPPRTHLNKDSRLKHLFKASISRLAIHQRLPWKWNTLFPLGPKANLFLTARPNSETNGIRSLNLCLLTPILIILVIAISSSCTGGAETQSSQAEITELTVTINGTDYPITFDTDRAFTVSIPAAETIPGKITVKSAVISEKASGLQASDELAVTNNQASITITAEDGTTISYTLSLNILPTKITAAEIPKKADTDVRDSYVLFTIEANKDLSDYHLAVKETNEAAPTAAEMTAGALKRNLSANRINVLIAQRLNAPIIAFAEQHFADKTHTTLGANMHGHFAGSNTGFVMDNDAAGTHAWVNLSVLQPNTMYKLYGMEDGKDTVIDMLSFHTDAAITDPIRSSAENVLRYVDSTLEKDFIEIAVNADEIYIFPHQFRLFSNNSIQVYRWNISGDGYPSLIGSSLQFFGDPTDDYSSSLILSKGRDLDSLLASYILLNTAVAKTKVSNGEVVYGSSLALSTVPGALATVFTSVLKPQELP